MANSCTQEKQLRLHVHFILGDTRSLKQCGDVRFQANQVRIKANGLRIVCDTHAGGGLAPPTE